ncbi:hypothetical protein EI94DRAFT_1705275 [Lactarius quietus]|nr:hypothetical protein EI94DRAFT_1705275 [Lactarius quietus]
MSEMVSDKDDNLSWITSESSFYHRSQSIRRGFECGPTPHTHDPFNVTEAKFLMKRDLHLADEMIVKTSSESNVRGAVDLVYPMGQTISCVGLTGLPLQCSVREIVHLSRVQGIFFAIALLWIAVLTDSEGFYKAIIPTSVKAGFSVGMLLPPR